MKVLLDECVTKKVRTALPEHEVRTVSEMGWSGITNGKLLALAAAAFDVFLTVDKNLTFQQNLVTLPITVVAIHSKSIRWEDVEQHIPQVRELLSAQYVAKAVYIIE